MSDKYLSIFTLVFLILGLQCGGNNDSEIKRLLDLPKQEQERTFKNFPLAKQVDVYIEAMYVEPPQERYASYLASNGKAVLPVLMNKLQETKKDTVKTYLIYSLKVMHQDYYSLSNESEVLKTLTESVRGITDTYRKAEAEDYLKDIIEKPGFDSKQLPDVPQNSTHTPRTNRRTKS